MSNVRVCVDVVGGDEKPQVVLDGIEAALAADPDIEVLAAGPAEIVNPFAASHARVEALEAPDVIAMDDDPIRAVMTKRKSSIVLACRAIKKGNADAFFSAGSTGAMTAAATAYVTPFRYMAEGKKQPVRPCLTNALPNRAGGLTVLCDMGANPDVEVDDMVRFAQMGSAYARVVLGIEHPRVGLLGNGTEDEKGSNFTKACFPAMKAAVPGFVGNCEGTDITSGNFDVVVADGMSGNIALKATEGAAKFLLQELKGAFMSSLGTKIAALLIKKQMREIKAKLSGDAKGGAILLGLRGVVLIGHGATSVEAVKNGTLAAAEAVRAGLVSFIISQRKSIPAIRRAVELLSERFGERLGSDSEGPVYAFPTAEALCCAGEQALQECGLGYRTRYVLHAAQQAAEGTLDLKKLASLPDEALFVRLMELDGVGKKVANCVCLFGYGRVGRVPVDVWIERLIRDEFAGQDPFPQFGLEAGIVQQYLFFYKRSVG